MKLVRKLAACSSGSFLRLRPFNVTYSPAHSDEAAFEGQAIVSEFVTSNETLKVKTIDSTVKAVQDEICLSKLEQARQSSVGQKLLAGPELFDMGLIMMRSGIRMRYPEYNEKADNHEQLDWKYIFGWTELHGTTPLLRQLCTEVPGLRLPPE